MKQKQKAWGQTCKNQLTKRQAKSLFYYRDGNLYWKHYKKNRKMNKPVGTISNGYLIFRMEGKLYRVHNCVYNMFVGKIKKGYCCHHINGIKHDNRIENLTQVTYKENNHYNEAA